MLSVRSPAVNDDTQAGWGLEVETACRHATAFPRRPLAWVLEARVLAALGRRAPRDSLLTATAALPVGTYWSHGAALVTAGEELSVHEGIPVGEPYLKRATEWLAQLRAEPGRREHRYWLAIACYSLGRYADADTVLAGLAREFFGPVHLPRHGRDHARPARRPRCDPRAGRGTAIPSWRTHHVPRTPRGGQRRHGGLARAPATGARGGVAGLRVDTHHRLSATSRPA